MPPRFFLCGRQDIGGRAPIAVVLCRWMLEISGNVPDRTGVWLVHSPILSGTKDLKSHDCDAWVRLGDRWACCVPGAPFFPVQWTRFAHGGLHVVDCDAWRSWDIGVYWLWI